MYSWIFDQTIDIDEYLKPKLNSKKSIFFNSLNFLKVDKKRFPIINLKSRLNEHYSSPIIINAANEILVDQFLKKKIGCLDINRFILAILKDINYKKYAIKRPRNLNQINLIDKWARSITYKVLK